MEAYWFFFRPPVISHLYTVYVSSFLFSLSSAIQFWIIQLLVYSTFFSLQLLSLLFSPEIGRLHRFGEPIHIVLSFSPSILQSVIFSRSSVTISSLFISICYVLFLLVLFSAIPPCLVPNLCPLCSYGFTCTSSMGTISKSIKFCCPSSGSSRLSLIR
jgi:hypothetical protein